MAELTPEGVGEICEVFLPAFNRDHGREFVLGEIPVASHADFTIQDGDEEIPVQHVRAMENPLDDVVKPKNADRFEEGLRRDAIETLPEVPADPGSGHAMPERTARFRPFPA